MSDDRELILSRVRGALAPLGERAALPDYDGDLAVMRQLIAGRDLVELFTERMLLVNGLVLTDASALASLLRESGWLHGYCDPVLWFSLAPAFGAGFAIETGFDRSRVEEYTFGITRAAGAVAETGTIILEDRSTSHRLAALAPWVHVAALKRGEIFADLSQAVSALGDDPNVIWCTGSSSTADIESILVRGVHGPGVQIALMTGP